MPQHVDYTVLNFIQRTTITRLLLLAGIFLCAFYVLDLYAEGRIRIAFLAYESATILALYALALGLNLILWRELVHRQTGKVVPLPLAIIGAASLMVGKYVPGKIFGLVGRFASLPSAIDYHSASSSVFFEQVYLLASFVVLGLLALIPLLGEPLYGFLSAFFFLGVVFLPRIAFHACNSSGNSLLKTYASAISGLTLTGSVKLLFKALAAAGCVSATAYFAPSLLDLPIETGDRFLVSCAYAAGIAAGMLAILIPGGIGVREGVFVTLSQSALNMEEALAVAALLRLINVTIDLVVGVIGAILSAKVRR